MRQLPQGYLPSGQVASRCCGNSSTAAASLCMLWLMRLHMRSMLWDQWSSMLQSAACTPRCSNKASLPCLRLSYLEATLKKSHSIAYGSL